MKHVRGDRVVLACLLAGCTVDQEPSFSEVELATTVCGSGPTVKGVDVSYYQGNIDWAAAKADGVEYAFIRVSDGLGVEDSKFDQNWQATREHGILRGVYQYFRPNQDAIAQADLLLTRMGALEANDLPPVIDVETMGGVSAAEVRSQMHLWIDRVQAATGMTPIVYTGFYFWRDQVGGPAEFGGHPLWHAQYTSAECPNIPAPWQDWAFWQYTDSGAVDGIPGGVDTNRFNGTRDQLLALTSQPAECTPLDPAGGTIDDGDPCFRSGGPQQYLRRPSDAGEAGDLIWTHTIDKPAEVNFGHWTLLASEAGRYQIEVSTPGAYAQSKQARYVIRANGSDHEVVIDQSAVDGWQSLGEFELATGGDQYVHVGDNTGEPSEANVQIVFDAVRITRVTPPADEDPNHHTNDDEPADEGGCSTSGASSSGLLSLALALLTFVRRRR